MFKIYQVRAGAHKQHGSAIRRTGWLDFVIVSFRQLLLFTGDNILAKDFSQAGAFAAEKYFVSTGEPCGIFFNGLVKGNLRESWRRRFGLQALRVGRSSFQRGQLIRVSWDSVVTAARTAPSTRQNLSDSSG